MQKPLYELKENPLSIAIYGEAEDVNDLVEAIKVEGILTDLIIKPDGTILSGHRRYRAARLAGLITVPVKVMTPRDAAQEERWIIFMNRQRKKTETQLFNEITRLKALWKDEGRERKSEARKQGWNKYREQKVDFSNLEKSTTETTEALPIVKESLKQDEETQPIEDIYNELMERTAEKESQTQHSAVKSQVSAIESTHSEEQSQLSEGQTQPCETQSQPKPEPVNMNKKIAQKLGISTGHLHRLETVGEAAKAGVPEAMDALKRADAGEITINRAYEITKKATTPEKPIQIPFSEGAAAIPGTALHEFYKRAKPVGAWVEELKSQLRHDSPDMTLSTAYSLSGFVAVELLRYRELSAEIEDYIERHGGDDIEQDEGEYED